MSNKKPKKFDDPSFINGKQESLQRKPATEKKKEKRVNNTSNQEKKRALSEAFEGAETLKEFHKLLKRKTLSDLQSTAAQLGFEPSSDKNRLYSVLLKEYHKQSS